MQTFENHLLRTTQENSEIFYPNSIMFIKFLKIVKIPNYLYATLIIIIIL